MAALAKKTGNLRTISIESVRRSCTVAVCSAALFLCQFAALAIAQHPHPRHKEELKRQVEKLEEAWRTAQLNGDVEAMDRLLSDDYIGITMNGQIVTKAQQLDRMRSRTVAVSKIDLDDVKVKLIGQTAVVTSRAEVAGTNDGQPIEGTYRYTRVYARTPNGSWKITNFEATRVGEPPASRRARGLEPPTPAEPPAQQKWAAGSSPSMH